MNELTKEEKMNVTSKFNYYLKKYNKSRKDWEFIIGFQNDNYILLFNKMFEKTGTMWHLGAHQKHVWDICQINKYLVVLGMNKSICFWDTNRKLFLLQYSNQLQGVTKAICYVPLTKRVIVACFSCRLYAYDYQSEKLLIDITLDNINHLVYHDKLNIIVGSSNSSIYIINPDNLEIIRIIQDDVYHVRKCLFLENNQILSSNMNIYDIQSGKKEGIMEAKEKDAYFGMAQINNDLIIYGNNKGGLFLYNFREATIIKEFNISSSPITRVIPICKYLVLVSCENRTIYLFDIMLERRYNNSIFNSDPQSMIRRNR